MTVPGLVQTGPDRALRYVLVTPAHNEERFIDETLSSVVCQTRLPELYVVVDDGSTDRTAAIAERYAEGRPWLRVLRLPAGGERNFARKARAFNAGLEQTNGLAFDCIGNLDADVSLEADHFEYLLSQFARDHRLGVAGTVYTQPGFNSMSDSFEGEECVAGPLQLFRRECFIEIGGYVANPLGGIDWIAVTTARMKGWRTRTFAARRYYHHRSMGTANRSHVGAMFDYGRKDYFLGGGPLWECGRVCYRMGKRPLVAGGLALLAGYCYAAITRLPRPVDRELISFHRREQGKKLARIIGSILSLRGLDKFHTAEPHSAGD